MKFLLPLRLFFVCWLLCIRAAVGGPTVETLYSWQAPAQSPSGTLCKGTDGNFYGVTSNGGEGHGTVFRVTPAGVMTVIHSFQRAEGTGPSLGLVEGADGFFYGTTSNGGLNSAGTIFKINPSGFFFVVLQFQNTPTAGASGAMIRARDGNFYGTTLSGGANRRGAIYRLTPAGEFTVLYDFTTATGTQVWRLVQGLDGNFYATSYSGGANGRGTIFKVTPAGAATVLFNFPATGEGAPEAGLVAGPDGNFYGTCNTAVFRITPEGAYTSLHTFVAATGTVPRGELVLASDGYFYGTTIRGGTSGNGTVYRIDTAGQFAKLAELKHSTDYASLIEKTPGTLLGVTDGGWNTGLGTVFEVTVGGVVTDVTDFTSPFGYTPSGPLVEGDGGSLFSTTTVDGDSGTIYRMPLDGPVETLAKFPYFGPVGQARGGVTIGSDHAVYGVSGGSSGNYGVIYKTAQTGGPVKVLKQMTSPPDSFGPQGRMTQAPDGNFYGTSYSYYGGGDPGSVFKITPAGAFTKIVAFSDPNGYYPYGTLTLNSDGKLYGTSPEGGSLDRGTVFRVTPGANPTFETLVTFVNSNGQTPTGVLLAAPNGNIYGTTLYGGTNNVGTVFQITPAGVHTLLASVGSVGAARPRGAIALANDGNFYGVTSEGGANGFGCVYRMTPTGNLAVIHSFEIEEPVLPMNGLTLGVDGALYGTTSAGGETGRGSVFRITTNGAITHLKQFNYVTGEAQVGEFFRASDGALYGVNATGGTGGGGTLLRIDGRATVTTLAATGISFDAATLNGVVNPNGGATDVTFEYGTTATLGSSIAVGNVGAGDAPVPVGVSLSALPADTLYYFRVAAANPSGVRRGAILTFRTTPPEPPVPVTGAADEITVTSALLHGMVSARGAATTVYFQRGDQPTEAQWIPGDPASVDGSAINVPFTARISGLRPHTPYTVTAIGRNQAGTTFGSPANFTTLNTPPFAAADTVHPTSSQFDLNPSLNDSDLDGDSLTITSATNGSQGSVTLLGGNAVHYVGGSSFMGNDTFTYAMGDSYGGTATAQVTLVNAAPSAGSLISHSEFGPGGSASRNVAGVITDPDGDTLRIVSMTAGAHGGVSFDGFTVRYGPTDGAFDGNDSFTYTISDGAGATATGTIAFTNAAPLAQPDKAILSRAATPLEVLANDTDPDGDVIAIVALGEPSYGTATTDGKTITYTPGEAFPGIDSFSYTIGDGRGATATAQVDIKANYPVMRLLATTGGTIAGVEGATFKSFGIPSIFSRGGSAGWLASARAESGTFQGIFSGPLGAPVLRVRKGDAAPELGGATTFASFKDPVFGGENFAFLATAIASGATGQSTQGIWVHDGVSLRLIARIGNAAPQPGIAVLETIRSLALPGENAVFFSGVSPALATGKKRAALWVWTRDAGSRVALEQDQIFSWDGQSRTVKSFQTLGKVPFSAGHGRYDAGSETLDALIAFTDGSEATAVITARAEVRLIRVTGATDAEGHVAVAFGIPSSPGRGELPVALVSFQSGAEQKPNASKQMAVVSFVDDAILAKAGDAAPDANGALFGALSAPVAGFGSADERVNAFHAKLVAAARGALTGIWAHEVGRTPSQWRVAQAGMESPGASGAKFASFESVTVLERRGPAFIARLTRGAGDVNGGNDRGFWATNSDGALELIFREGDPLYGKVLRSFTLLAQVPKTPGQQRAWCVEDFAPRVVWRGEFTDGSAALLMSTVP